LWKEKPYYRREDNFFNRAPLTANCHELTAACDFPFRPQFTANSPQRRTGALEALSMAQLEPRSGANSITIESQSQLGMAFLK
jgi:hypothetical protein